MIWTYNIIASIAFLIAGAFFAYDGYLGSGDGLSRLFAALFLAVGTVRMLMAIHGKRRQKRAQAQALEKPS